MDKAYAEALRMRWGKRKKQGSKNLKRADPTGWTQHTKWHWSRDFGGARLDYWPSRNKWMFGGEVMTGDVQAWMRKQSGGVDAIQ